MKGNRPPITPGFKLWLESGESRSVFGVGKWRLLREIDRCGSLSGAAGNLGISYRKAWGDIRKAETALNVKLLERRRGGKDGGEMFLTAEGRKWVREYGRFQRRVEGAVHSAYAAWRKRMLDSGDEADREGRL